MKTRTCISDIDSRSNIGTFEVFLEVYQLTLLGVSTNPPRRVSLTTFFGQKCVQKVMYYLVLALRLELEIATRHQGFN